MTSTLFEQNWKKVFSHFFFRTEKNFFLVKWPIFELLKRSFFLNTLFSPVHSDNAYENSITTQFVLRIRKNGYFCNLLRNTINGKETGKIILLILRFNRCSCGLWGSKFCVKAPKQLYFHKPKWI